MRILVVGDTHGDRTPLEIAKAHIDEVDKVVFLGDYVDSFDNKWPEQKAVLEDIIAFKNDKVELIWGNHDHSYISDPYVSGHQDIFHEDMNEFFKAHLDLFNIVFIQDNWIFSHAGVSDIWLKNPEAIPFGVDEEETRIKLEDVNTAFHGGRWPIFDHNSYSCTGDCETEGPLWIRPSSLMTAAVKGYNQVVGHTELNEDTPMEARVLQGCKTNIKPLKDRDEKIVLVDSQKRNIYAMVDTSTDEVIICRS